MLHKGVNNNFELPPQENHEILTEIGEECGFKQEKKITLDDRRIATMVPAGILAYLLIQFTRKNRTEFEYHELLENCDCTFDALAPNLSVRVKRLAGILEKKCPSIRIHPTGRGTFSLSVNCNLRFVEM
jgi:hypothetical protein